MGALAKTLHYQKIGRGDNIVLIHGFLSSSSYWTRVQKELSKTHTVIVIDLLGFGKSPKPRQASYSADEQVTHVHHTLKKALNNKPFTLVGHSMGSLIATKYAAKHPELLQKLILVAPPVFLNSKQAHEKIVQTNMIYRLALYTPFGRLAWPAIRLALKALPNNEKTKTRHSIAHGLKYSSHHSRSKSLKNLVEVESLPDLINKLSLKPIILAGRKDRAVYTENIKKTGLEDTAEVYYFKNGHHHFIVSSPEILKKYI